MVRNSMRILLPLFLMLFSVNLWGQHLNMFGIPLNGSIDNFTTKLVSKGLKVDREFNKQLPNGVRAFKGSFSGYLASKILIFYDPRTKTVFKGVTNFTDLPDQTLLEMYGDIRARIHAKYENFLYYDDKNDEGFPKCEINVFKPNSDTCLGVIQIGIMVMKVYPYSKTLYISYEDNINMDKFTKQRSDDL